MRLFEKCEYKTEIAPAIRHKIGPDQFAYKEGHNSTMALIKCQHTWLTYVAGYKRQPRMLTGWILDTNAKYVRVYHLILVKHLTMCYTNCCLKKLKNYLSIRTL